MQALLFSLLVASLSVELGCSLKCYSCLARTPISKCLLVKDCAPGENECMTTKYTPDTGYPFRNESDVVSDCVLDCTPTSPGQIGAKTPIFCCDTDLCNDKDILLRSHGAPGVRASYAGLAVYATFASTFLLTGLH